MKANEFVKKFGVNVAKDLAYRDKTSIGWLSVEHHNLNQDDLKRLVEAHELVMEHGSVERAKKYADSPYTAPEIKVVLDKAIADVESCQ